MALAEAAKLIATLDLGGNFVKNLGGADRALGKFDAHIDRSQSKAFQAGQHIGTGIKAGVAIAAAGIGLLATNVALGLNSLVELEQQQAQTNAVLKSTKGAAGISAQAVGDLAEKYESLNAIIGDELIRSTENMLLTFTNIKGKAFEPALQAVLDINTAMGKGPEGLQQTAIQVGKALNDPVKGLTALTRIGVTFDKGQVKRIKQLQKEGKVYEAQKIIIAELNREFGGSFIAQGQTTAGKVAAFTDSIEDLQRALAEALLPTLGNVATALSTFLRDPATVEGIRKLGQNIAKFFTPQNIAKGISLLKNAVSAIASIAGPVLSVLREAISLFQKMPPWAQKLIIGGFLLNKATGGGVTNVGGGIADAIAKGLAQGLAGATISTIIKSILGTGASTAAGAAGAAETTTVLGSLARLLGGSVVLPVTISAIAVAAAGAIANAIDPTARGTGKPGSPIVETLSNRDPRRFDENGRIIQNSVQKGVEAGLPDNLAKSQDIEGLRGAIAAALQPGRGIPGGTGHTPGDTQGGMESHRGERADALSAAEIAAAIKAALTGSATFQPTVKLDPSQIKDLRQDDSFDAIEKLRTQVATTSKDSVDGIEAMRGDLSSGIDNTKAAIDNATGAVQSLQGTTTAGLNNTSTAARTAGFTAANAAYGAARGIEGAIAANRPIINVDVNISATTVEHTVTVTDRNGPSGGSASDDLRGYPH